MKNRNMLKPKRKPVEKPKDVSRGITSNDMNNTADITTFSPMF